MGFGIRGKAKRTARWMVNTLVFNRAGREVNYRLRRLSSRLRPPRGLKLHLGCGAVRLDGFINIDHRWTRATDLVCDIRRLPFPDGSAGRIETYHVIEHLSPEDVERALGEWRRVLAPGGILVIECPDFEAAVQEYLEGNRERIYSIFGRHRFTGDVHLAGYNPERLTELLQRCGFDDLVFQEPQDYHKDQEPCLRVVTRKPD